MPVNSEWKAAVGELCAAGLIVTTLQEFAGWRITIQNNDRRVHAGSNSRTQQWRAAADDADLATIAYKPFQNPYATQNGKMPVVYNGLLPAFRPVPQGRNLVAQQFTAGWVANRVQSRRDDTTSGSSKLVVSSLTGLGRFFDPFPVLKHWAIIFRPCGTDLSSCVRGVAIVSRTACSACGDRRSRPGTGPGAVHRYPLDICTLPLWHLPPVKLALIALAYQGWRESAFHHSRAAPNHGAKKKKQSKTGDLMRKHFACINSTETAGISPDDPLLAPITNYDMFPGNEAWIRDAMLKILERKPATE